jgi:hypothetical protein
MTAQRPQQHQQQPLFASPPTVSGNTNIIPSNAENLQFYTTSYGSQQQLHPQQQQQKSQQGYVGGYSDTMAAQYSTEKTRMFVGSPFGTGGYSDEPPLLEG